LTDICEPIGGISGVYIAIGGAKAGIEAVIEIVVPGTVGSCLAAVSISRSI
jgi:hypothetical protein